MTAAITCPYCKKAPLKAERRNGNQLGLITEVDTDVDGSFFPELLGYDSHAIAYCDDCGEVEASAVVGAVA